LPTKFNPEKKPQSKKIDRVRFGIWFPVEHRRVFFDCGFFSGWIFVDKLQVPTKLPKTFFCFVYQY
jgi:hypothetical protein